MPTLNLEFIILLKNLTKFWRIYGLPLIKYERELDLSWLRNRVMKERHNNITGVNFMITSTKVYVTVITFSLNDNI